MKFTAMFQLLPAALWVLLSVSAVQVVEGCELAAPRDVHFHSVNLRNTVRWSPGTANTHRTTYRVEYAIYGDAVDMGGTEQVAWRPVGQCDDITQTECDVTEETNDMEEEYYVRVRANGPDGCSDWTETDKRLRLTDTILGPPQVNVSVVENKLDINLSGPFRWKSPGKKRQSMFKIFPHMKYNITVYNNRSKRTQYFPQTQKFLHYGPLEYNSEYCVRAEVVSLSLHLTNMLSNWICVSTPDDPLKSQTLLMMLGGVVPSAICLFVLSAVGGFAYYYICGHKQKLPISTMDIHKKPQMFQPENHLPINVIMIITNPSTGESKPSFPGSLYGGEHISECLQLINKGDTIRQPYAVQNIQNISSLAAAAGNVQSHRGSVSEDYVFVHHDDGNQVTCCPYNPQVGPHSMAGVHPYMAQAGMTEQPQMRYEEGEDEEEGDTGQLQLDFPLLRRFGLETSESTETQVSRDTLLLPHHPVLRSVVVKQASEESGEEDLLLKLATEWDLQVQSTTE